MNPSGVCSGISPPCAPALTINSSFSKQRLCRPTGPHKTSPSHTPGSTRRQRERKEYQLFSGPLQRLAFPFLSLFCSKAHLHLTWFLWSKALPAKPCSVPMQRHLHLHCRGHCVSPPKSRSPPAPPSTVASPVSRAVGLHSSLLNL